jgi:small subunit ribosomal protein S3
MKCYDSAFAILNCQLRSYFSSIRPPTRLTFGFRLGRCIILHFPKRAFIHFFLPRRPLRLKRRDKSRLRKDKGRWWAFGKVGPIRCLHSSEGTKEERNEVRGQGQGKESSRSTGRSKTKSEEFNCDKNDSKFEHGSTC